MTRQKFPLTSDQLETLLAFEKKGSLNELAVLMAKDPSVVSRNLQRIAETLPVISKVSGRWNITPLGLQLNKLTSGYLEAFESEVREITDKAKSQHKNVRFKSATLIIVNAQNALLSPKLGKRNNQEVEANIKKSLDKWRFLGLNIIHVRHVSHNEQSLFYDGSFGAEIIPLLSPRENELVLNKTKSGAFSDTNLHNELSNRSAETIILTGFTANDCIDVTARQATELGFSVAVISDATATFDIQGHDGKIHPAERVHELVLANLHAQVAEILTSAQLWSLVSNS